MKIYQIDCSARKKGSASRELAKKLLEKIKKSEDEVIYRDLDDEMLRLKESINQKKILTKKHLKLKKRNKQQHKI